MEMVIATSDYWQAAHGLDAGEVLRDTEGVEVMAKLGRNVAWLVNLIHDAKGRIDPPATGQRTMIKFYTLIRHFPPVFVQRLQGGSAAVFSACRFISDQERYVFQAPN